VWKTKPTRHTRVQFFGIEVQRHRPTTVGSRAPGDIGRSCRRGENESPGTQHETSGIDFPAGATVGSRRPQPWRQRVWTLVRLPTSPLLPSLHGAVRTSALHRLGT
jgi:hypothetical protein